ncbi:MULTISPECIES: aldehyde dehydrogenase family protein [unclassified Rhodococcus (in: high G+C Gram-positive bacteria)]|uniref:aldehyde dehydrogenase family protein n=1 Tax=unclassified Rhodococcus (in: high G+C Gram-positive bacteria) TaxID=192944 RepID=UPI00096A6697|nr:MULTISPECIES: aldehyde dehydrogenase family protein [unclassified Rhodococcus (in: high G+C Gram-positive bacteria)]
MISPLSSLSVPWSEDMFIDGELVRGESSERLTVDNPATEEVFADFPAASTAQVGQAVESARRAFESDAWKNRSLRREVLLTMARVLEENAEMLAASIVREVGTPVTLARALQIGEPIALLRAFADLTMIDRDRALGIKEGSPRSDATITYQPSGVVAAIAAYNYPLLFMATKLGGALAAGCTAVLLPSPQAPMSILLFARLLADANIPRGVVNIIAGGIEVGQALTTHPDVNKISFTGSVGVGQQVMAQAAPGLKRVALELGGKSPSLLLPGVDIDSITDQVHARYLRNAGQGCSSPTRILVHETQYEEFVELSQRAFNSLKIGDPWDDTVVAGPLISAKHRDRVEGYLERAVGGGGKIVAGGGRPEMPNGWFMNGALVGGVTNKSEIAREELFGPVGVVLPYQTVEEAISIANDSDFGLAATIYGDIATARGIAPQLRVGTVMINGWIPRQDKAGGGFKMSGMGREIGEEGVREFLETQFIAWPEPA